MSAGTDASSDAAASFTPLRTALARVAYRMLGSVADAEDVVQEAFVRWLRTDRDGVRNPEAFLRRMVTRLCLDQLKSARRRRETYVGPWLPEPVVAPETGLDVDEDVTLPLLMALDRLSPLERAAFLLHDVFDTPFPEIAVMLDRTEASCRQLASRARRAVRDDRPVPAKAPDNHARLLQAFGEAVASGNVARLAELLRADAVALTDGGGRKTAARNPIVGAEKIARFFIGIAAKNAGHDMRIEPAMINGAFGALLYLDGELDNTMSMAISGEKIAAIYIVRNPDKLRHLPAAATH